MAHNAQSPESVEFETIIFVIIHTFLRTYFPQLHSPFPSGYIIVLLDLVSIDAVCLLYPILSISSNTVQTHPLS